MPPRRTHGPAAIYCSSRCLNAAHYARNRHRLLADGRRASAERRAAAVKDCASCGAEFTPVRDVRQMYCSRKCSGKAHRDSSARICSEPDCERPYRAKGLCNMHYRRVLRSQGLLKGPAWSPKRKAAWKARESLARGAADAEKFDYAEIYERDGWICGICTEPVDRDLAWPDPMSVSLDHIIPVSRGGRHSRDNAQCSHLTCNIRKSDAVQVA